MKTKKNRKVKGSVLLTVVSVMALLILFLFGTLALATAANNRAHVNYSSSQTGITSRMLVNTAYNAIKEDETFANAITSLDASSGVLNIPVDISSNSTNVSTFGNIDSLTAEYVGTKKYYNSSKAIWEDCDLIKLTASVTMNGVTTHSCAYIVKDPPTTTPGGGGGGGAGFVTTGSAAFSCKANLYGGSYVNIPSLSEATTYDYFTNYATYTGNYRRFKEGSTTQYSEVKFSNDESLIEADTVINSNANFHHLTKMFYPGQGHGIAVWGDAYFDNNTFNLLKEINSNLKNSTTSDIAFNKIPYLYVDCELSGDPKIGPHSASGREAFPFNTFAGNINATGNNLSIAGDLYLMNPDQQNTITVLDADLYSWTASVITKAGEGSTSMVQGKIYSKGNITLGASNGGGLKTKGINCEKDIEVVRTLVVDGDIVCGGTFKNSGNLTCTGTIYCNHIEGNATGATERSLADYTGQIYPDYAERGVIIGKTVLNGPGGAIDKKDSQVVMTMEDILKDVIDPYKNSDLPPAMMTEYNNLITSSTDTFTSLNDVKNASGYKVCTGWQNGNGAKLTYSSSGSGWPVISQNCVLKGPAPTINVTTEMVQTKWWPTPEFEEQTKTELILSGTLFSNGDIPEIDGRKAVVFDPGAGEMLVVLDNFSVQNPVEIIVDDSQGGTVYFYIKPGTAAVFENSILTSKYLNLFRRLGTSEIPSFQVFTDSSYALSDPNIKRFNDDLLFDGSYGLSVPPSAKKYAPGLKIYGGANSIMWMNNMETIAAQIVSPNINLHIDSTDNKHDLVAGKNVYYNGDKISTSSPKSIFGCCNAKYATLKNIANVVYIPDDDTGAGTPPTPAPGVTHWYEMLYYDEY